MDYAAHWEKLTSKENPFRTGWCWIVSGLSIALAGGSPLLLYIGLEKLTGYSGGNPIGLGLLAIAGFGLSQLCLFVALIWIAYGIFRTFSSPPS